MIYDLDYEIFIDSTAPTEITQIGDEFTDSNLVIRSTYNEKLIYLDGTGQEGAPIYLGIVKSQGTQKEKLPVTTNNILGGLQVYARSKAGKSLGYCPEETPLVGSIIFATGEVKEKIPTSLMIALTDNSSMKVKLILDENGNLKTTGNISSGKLTITDTVVKTTNKIKKYIKVLHDKKEYALPLYEIL